MKHWGAAHPGQQWNAGSVDAVLHRQRSKDMGTRPPMSTREVEALPSGAFFSLHNEPWLLWEGTAFKWGHCGYSEVEPLQALLTVTAHDVSPTLITPEGIVSTLRAGWKPRPPHNTAFLHGQVGGTRKGL